MSSQVFEAFLRSSNLVVNDVDIEGLNIEELKAKFPRFRQYEYPVKIADDQGIIVPSAPTQAPVAEVPLMVTSSPSSVSDVTDPVPISCVSDMDGDFFIASSFTVTYSQVDFAYEIVYDDVADLTTEVLPVLEKAIVDSMLPTIFGAVCSERRLQTNNLNVTNRRALIGASASPPDIVSGKNCAVATENCSVVDGKMTFYKDGEADLSTIAVLACAAMNDPAVLGSHPAIISLRCTGGGNGAIINDNTVSNQDYKPASQNIGRNFYILSSLAGLMILFGAYAYRRRKTRKTHEKEDKAVLHLDDSDLQNVSSYSDMYSPTSFRGPNAFEVPKKPAFDLRPISPPVFNGEPIHESLEEDEEHDSDSRMLDEVSLFEDNTNSYDISNMS